MAGIKMGKVLQLISSGGFYGAERVLITLSSELRRIGMPCVIGAFHHDFKPHTEVLDYARALDLPTEAIPCRGKIDWNTVARIREIVKRENIEIIHSHNQKSNLYAWLAARGGRTALLSTCHGWIVHGAKTWAATVLDRWILRRFDCVVLVSQAMAPKVRAFGIEPRVIENGIECEPFLAAAPALRRELGWGDGPVIAAVGRLAPEKGLANLLSAGAALIREFPNLRIVLAGDGPLRQELEALAEQLGISPRTHFLGVRQDIPELLASIDILALPSYSEGLPITLLEAMAAGRAVAASTVGSIPRLVQDAVTGLLVSPGDVAGLTVRLRTLLANRALREELGANARRLVMEQYSAATMSNAYAGLYRKLRPDRAAQNRPAG